jgi:hypothetical protein
VSTNRSPYVGHQLFTAVSDDRLFRTFDLRRGWTWIRTTVGKTPAGNEVRVSSMPRRLLRWPGGRLGDAYPGGATGSTPNSTTPATGSQLGDVYVPGRSPISSTTSPGASVAPPPRDTTWHPTRWTWAGVQSSALHRMSRPGQGKRRRGRTVVEVGATMIYP